MRGDVLGFVKLSPSWEVKMAFGCFPLFLSFWVFFSDFLEFSGTFLPHTPHRCEEIEEGANSLMKNGVS
ncbi:MAG: hypothetical protein AOA65_0247 [Candidatus Bathyarchaeota archaeon BA1]|nr:MAG: hypothetical protein AOA65_0247 [Candidatus Bathyarchaeota archaeon BA1]